MNRNKKRIKSLYYFWLDWKLSAKVISSILCVTILSISTLMTITYVNNISQMAEKTGGYLVSMGDQAIMRATDQVSAEVKILETLAKTPSLVTMVEKANQDRDSWTREQIAALDKAWTDEDSSIEIIVQEVAGNELSVYLIDFIQNNPEEVEVFVTDVKGLNVAMTNRTSDFLQKDESWWKAAYASGNGANYIGSVEFDESSKAYAMNIGVPIRTLDTHEVVGVLRGTLDMSVMINALGNIDTSETGSIILVNSQGIILYSQASEQILQPVSDKIMALFKSRQGGWTNITDANGNPQLVAYSSIGWELGKSLDWRMVITQELAELRQYELQNLIFSLLAGLTVLGVGMLVTVLIINSSIAMPLVLVTKMAQALSVGDLVRDLSDHEKDKLRLRKDEIGIIGQAFDNLINYIQDMGAAATAIASKDLTLSVIPKSEKDELGNAFAKMVTGLREAISQVTESASAVSSAATQLANVAEQSGEVTSQIATTIQQVALGTTHQIEGVTRTSGAVEQMSRAIEGIAKGALEQEKAISKTSELASRINTTIDQVANNARVVAHDSAEATRYSSEGARTVEATIAGMQTIKTKVGLSAQKVREMGQRSEKIDTIVETIEDIASQTNLLALNAAIESARVQATAEKTVENLLQQHLLGTVSLVTDMLASGHDLHSEDLITLARLAQVDDFCISDSDGVIIASNQPGSLGFRFSEDPCQESSVFRPLLNQRDGIVIRPVMLRDQDGKPYVYVGVSRRDRPGIVQAGTAADLVYRLGSYSRGFAVVADEVSNLAEHAKSATKEVAVLIHDLQKTVAEAVVVMEDGVRDVESGSARTTEAGESLAAILKAAEAVSQQVAEIATAVQHMSTSSCELVSAMETVSAVVEENTAATEEMAANSTELNQAIGNIASVSEENNAAAEEVSASTEEISAQVEEVSASATAMMEMAQSLQQVVDQFKLT